MKFDELVKYILKEAPITDVEVYSDRYPALKRYDFDKVSDYTDPFIKNGIADLALIRNKRYRERLQAETAKNIPFNIKLIFVDVGAVKQERPTPGVITLVTQPSGDPMVLSPNKKGVWMVGHKLGHALDVHYGIWSIIFHILKAANIDIDNNIPHDDLLQTVKDVSGFRSAQQGTLQNTSEYVYELVAQYVMFGKVTFKVGNILKTAEEASKVSKEVTNAIIQTMHKAVGDILYDVEE